MMEHDVAIIGAGPAGYVCAIRLGQLGKRVVLVERERVGGVCMNWGCIPVKSLLRAAATVRNAQEAKRMGLVFGSPQVDLVSLCGWKGRVVDRLVRGVEYLLKTNGVELVRGEAKWTSPNLVTVSGQEGEQRLEAGAFVVATGSRPAGLPGLEPDGRTVLDSNQALSLVELPKRLAIVGAGVIGLEFATVFSRLGCEVTVLESCGQVLPGVDRDLALALKRTLAREGIRFVLGCRVQGLDRAAGLGIRYLTGDEEACLDTDAVLVAVGREPLSRELGLEWAGVKTDGRGWVKVDSSYRTSAEGIYAVGDVVGGPLLAHKAMAEGIALAEVLAGTGRRVKHRAIPTVVYTDPEVAVVGLSESEAREQGREVRVSRVPLTAIGRSLTLGRSEGLCKMVADEKTGRILGVGMVAPQADTVIAEATVAVELGLTAEQLGRVVHPHPTMSELLFEAAAAIGGRAIHIANP